MRNARGVIPVSRWSLGVALLALALAGCGGSSASNPQAVASSSSSSSTATSSTSSAPPNQVKSATGAADVSWTPPTTTAGGSTLLNLAGYDIYYGTSPSALTQKIQVTNVGVTTYVISGLTSGTWYFAVTSYTSNGAQSVPSNVVSKTIS